MSGLHSYFQWYYYQGNNRHLFGLCLSLFFWLFLAITQPFGIQIDSSLASFIQLLVWLLPMAVSWFLVIYLSDPVINKIARGKQKERLTPDLLGWTAKLILVIHAIYLFRAYSCQWSCMDLTEYAQIVLACLLIFLLVYLPFANYAKSIYLKSVFSGFKGKLGDHEVRLSEGKRSVVVNLRNVVFVKADRNHLDFYSLQEGSGIKKTTYRMTLAHLEDLLKNDHPGFKRVHRSYMANLNYFDRYESSSGNYSLKLQAGGHVFEIPVSRTYHKKLREIL